MQQQEAQDESGESEESDYSYESEDQQDETTVVLHKPVSTHRADLSIGFPQLYVWAYLQAPPICTPLF